MVGKLTCQRCGAEAEGRTFDEADEKIDHARGLSRGRPCSGDPNKLIWTGTKTTEKSSSKPEKTTPKKEAKSKSSSKK